MEATAALPGSHDFFDFERPGPGDANSVAPEVLFAKLVGFF
jgi:hypothetical protein